MHALILAVTLLGSGPGENGWPTLTLERGNDIWPDRELAWQSLVAALEGLANGESKCDAEESLFDEEVELGTTRNLPTFNFATTTSMVHVPDGGKVLLEGLQRLKEKRSDPSVPIMNKIPHMHTKHSGASQEAQSLMLMVTPRIIIQEEEEEKLGLSIPDETAAASRRTE